MTIHYIRREELKMTPIFLFHRPRADFSGFLLSKVIHRNLCRDKFINYSQTPPSSTTLFFESFYFSGFFRIFCYPKLSIFFWAKKGEKEVFDFFFIFTKNKPLHKLKKKCSKYPYSCGRKVD